MSNLPLCKLPLIISKGRFTHLSLLDGEKSELFLSYLIRFTCKTFGLEINHIPKWWTENMLYHPDFARGAIPAPECRNKNIKVRRLIKLCYLYYDCKNLLTMSEQLASLHHRSYNFMVEPSGCVAVYRRATLSVLVRVPSSNLDYDIDRISDLDERLSKPEFITRRPTVTSLLSPKKPVGHPEEVIILDSSSESEDEVTIVSYEPGALPPTPPKNRPGPACSKIRLTTRPMIGQKPAQRLTLVSVPGRNGSRVQELRDCRPNWPQGHQISAYRPMQSYVPYRHPLPQPQLPARSKYLLCRPRRNIKIEEVDLTVDDDEEEDVVQPTGPKDLSQSDFLARMGLGNSSDPEASFMSKKKTLPVMIQKNKRLNLRDIPFTMVPHLVSVGCLPRRALCSTADVDRRTGFINRHTSKDTNWFLVTVDTRNKREVEAVAKRCWVAIRRLNSADIRRWRRRCQDSCREI